MAPSVRPPIATRVLALVAAAAVGFVILAVMWSDRAPGVLSAAAGDEAHLLWDRINRSGQPVPGSDAVAHIVMWGGMTLLLSMVSWTYLGTVFTGGLVLLGSVAVEVGQQRFSQDRRFEITDLAANFVGVTIGVAAAVVVFMIGSKLMTSRRSPADLVFDQPDS